MRNKFVLNILFSFLLLSCSSPTEDYYSKPNHIWSDIAADKSFLRGKTLRILDIGNSYTEDGTDLLPDIVACSGINVDSVCYYTLVRSYGSFKTWFDCYNGKDDKPYYVKKILGEYDQNIQEGSYEAYDATGFKNALGAEWDLILVHPISSTSTDYSLWNKKKSSGYLLELLSVLKSHQPNATFGFVLVHSYADFFDANTEKDSYLRWKKNVQSVNELLISNNDIEIVIPYGTAIESLRHTEFNNDYDLTRDGTHLGYGLARYTAACTFFQALFYPRTGVGVEGNASRFTVPAYLLKEIQYPSSCIDVTDDNACVAQKLAVGACNNFSIISVPWIDR